MKYLFRFWASLFVLVTLGSSSNVTQNATQSKNLNTTDNAVASHQELTPEQNDAFSLEINYLKEQIELTQKKIQLIEKLKAYYLNNNETIPVTYVKVICNDYSPLL